MNRQEKREATIKRREGMTPEQVREDQRQTSRNYRNTEERRAYYLAHKEQAKAWYEANKERLCERQKERRRAKKLSQ